MRKNSALLFLRSPRSTDRLIAAGVCDRLVRVFALAGRVRNRPALLAAQAVLDAQSRQPRVGLYFVAGLAYQGLLIAILVRRFKTVITR